MSTTNTGIADDNLTSTTRRKRRERNVFGIHLYKLMASKDVRSAAELAELFVSSGYGDISRQTINDYATGKSTAPPRFGRKLVEVLKLSEREEQDLALTMLRGQG